MSTDAAVAWLRAQIEGDRARAETMAHFTNPGDDFYSCPASLTKPLGDLPWGPEHCQCGLAARQQDALADCEAKLAIIAEHAPVDWLTYGEYVCRRCLLEDDEPTPDGHHWIPVPCPTVKALATAYRHRPGYAGHWGAG